MTFCLEMWNCGIVLLLFLLLWRFCVRCTFWIIHNYYYVIVDTCIHMFLICVGGFCGCMRVIWGGGGRVATQSRSFHDFICVYNGLCHRLQTRRSSYFFEYVHSFCMLPERTLWKSINIYILPCIFIRVLKHLREHIAMPAIPPYYRESERACRNNGYTRNPRVYV